MFNRRPKIIQPITRDYRIYKEKRLNKVKPNIAQSGNLLKDLIRATIVRIILIRRKFSYIKQIITRRFFWGRSRSSLYIVHASLVFIVIALLFVNVNTKPSQSYAYLAGNSFQSKSLASTDDFSIATQAGETQIPDTRKIATVTQYTVQNGDNVSSIAERYGISADTVRVANNISSDLINPGQTLKILPVSGVLHIVQSSDTLDSLAGKYKLADSGLTSGIITEWNNFDIDNKLPVGSEIIIPGGRVTPVNNSVITSTYTQPNPPKQIFTPVQYYGDGSFVRPTSGGAVIVSQCYRGSLHDGVDIAKVWSGATPNVVATSGGTVIFNGYDGGWTVYIQHANGYESIYYHLAYPSGLSVGSKVSPGQVIGLMGSTGRSTGVHLHFTLRRNGVTINPMNVINLRNSGDIVSC